MCDLSLYVLSILLVKFTLIPKTLTLVLLKALIRTNDNRGFIFKVTFAVNIHSLKSTNFTMATVVTMFVLR